MLIYADSMTRHIGSFQSCFWGCVLCRLTRKYHWLVWQGVVWCWQGTWFLVSLIQRPSLLSDTVSLGFSFKLITVLRKSMWILFTGMALPTIRCRDKTWGWKSIASSSENYCRLHIYFVIVQIAPFIDCKLVRGREKCRVMAEMTP